MTLNEDPGLVGTGQMLPEVTGVFRDSNKSQPAQLVVLVM